ncbi:MAG: family 1 encapsulin nanocompartment shell protein [Acidimicrobiales bacterium]
MNHLLRSLAPITDRGWQLLDDEARSRLTPALAGRKLVDFSGPHGYGHSSLNLGHIGEPLASPVEGVEARLRRVLPLVEIRVPFVVQRDGLLDAERGAVDVDLHDLDRAAHQVALAENVAVFHGWEPAGIVGAATASAHEAVALGDDFTHYPVAVARAVAAMRECGVDGPYGLALGPKHYNGVVETAETGGHLLIDHLRSIIGGPVVWAPGADGGVLMSLRGHDFLFVSGEDLSIGYDHHDSQSVTLYIEETFAFQVVSPDAAVALTA